MTAQEMHQKFDELFEQYKDEHWMNPPMFETEEELERHYKTLMEKEWFQTALKEFEKGALEGIVYGREAYQVNEDGLIKSLSQKEIDEILNNPEMKVVKIIEDERNYFKRH